MRKFCAFFLAGALFLGTLACLPFTASAATDGDFEYTIENGEATITGYTGNASKLIIPATLGGYPVRVIGESAFSYCFGVTNVIFPVGLTTIGYNSFAGCRDIESIEISSGVKTIEDYAFFSCSGLKELVIPDGVTVIGYMSFRDCDNMESVTLGKGVETIRDSAFYGCSRNLKSIMVAEGNLHYKSPSNCLIEKKTGQLLLGCSKSMIPSGVTAIGNYAFRDCEGLTDIWIPDSVKTIGWYAFSDCSRLTNISIPGSVSEIQTGAFNGCRALESIWISEGVKKIGDSAFWFCESLTSIQIPASVEKMGSSVFNGCDALRHVYCIAPKQPDGWSEQWNWRFFPAIVHWGMAAPLSLGDLCKDGNIDAMDYLLLKRYCLGTYKLTDAQKAVADVNKDGSINALDYMLVKRHVLGTFVIE